MFQQVADSLGRSSYLSNSPASGRPPRRHVFLQSDQIAREDEKSGFESSPDPLRYENERRGCVEADPADGQIHPPGGGGEGQRDLRLC